MQVLWCTQSRKTPAAQKAHLKSGSVIKRKLRNLFEFEILRAKWEHEESRWSAKEEELTRQLDGEAYMDEVDTNESKY